MSPEVRPDGDDLFGFGDITAGSVVSSSVLPSLGSRSDDAGERIRAADAERRASMIRVAEHAAEIGLESAPALAAAAGLTPRPAVATGPPPGRPGLAEAAPQRLAASDRPGASARPGALARPGASARAGQRVQPGPATRPAPVTRSGPPATFSRPPARPTTPVSRRRRNPVALVLFLAFIVYLIVRGLAG